MIYFMTYFCSRFYTAWTDSYHSFFVNISRSVHIDARRRFVLLPSLLCSLGRTICLQVVRIPNQKRYDTQAEQTVQQEISGTRIEVGPDLGPGLTHKPPADGDVETSHEASETNSQDEVSALRPQANTWHQKPADCERETCACQCAQLYCSFLPDTGNYERGPGNPMQRLGTCENDTKSNYTNKGVKTHSKLVFNGLTVICPNWRDANLDFCHITF